MNEFRKNYCKYSHPVDPSIGRCRAGHMATSFDLTNPDIRIGFLDIETNHLEANFGYMYTWFIKELRKKKYYSGRVTKNDIENGTFDKRILGELADCLAQFDVVITYYGTGFDIPFIRTRCLLHNIPFPGPGDLLHWDIYYIARNKLKLHRNRLDNVANLFGIHGKTHLDPNIWLRAQSGNKKSLDYIYNHNKADVEVLEKVYIRLEGLWRKTKRSI